MGGKFKGREQALCVQYTLQLALSTSRVLLAQIQFWQRHYRNQTQQTKRHEIERKGGNVNSGTPKISSRSLSLTTGKNRQFLAQRVFLPEGGTRIFHVLLTAAKSCTFSLILRLEMLLLSETEKCKGERGERGRGRKERKNEQLGGGGGECNWAWLSISRRLGIQKSPPLEERDISALSHEGQKTWGE